MSPSFSSLSLAKYEYLLSLLCAASPIFPSYLDVSVICPIYYFKTSVLLPSFTVAFKSILSISNIPRTLSSSIGSSFL